MTLAEVQQLAGASSPLLRRAAADVTAARGAAAQARLHPNPTVGYQGDQIQPGPGPSNNVGQQGFYINQLIKTGGKLHLQSAAAEMDVVNAEVALRQAQVDLAGRVRAGYFAVLIAQEGLRVNRALSELAGEAYRLHVQRVRAAQAAGYEPLQLYVFALQARQNVVTARNRYVSAWKQLTAQMGVPDMPFTALAGRADAPVPEFRYPAAREHVLGVHTQVRTAENTILKAKYRLRLMEVERLPDLHTNFVYQHDNAASNHQFSLQLGFSVPVFDRNQGNILQAKAQVTRAVEDLEATRNDLTQRLAEAFERYENARVLTADYRERILVAQIRVYRGIRERYQLEPEKVSFSDLVNAQQNLANVLTTYLALLGSEWTAVVDMATLLQLDELYVPGAEACGPPLPARLGAAVEGY
jgi:cobalt-zinc-cadmium efflux system outer membrane protein